MKEVSSGQLAKTLNVTRKTIDNWRDDGYIVSFRRTESGRTKYRLPAAENEARAFLEWRKQVREILDIQNRNAGRWVKYEWPELPDHMERDSYKHWSKWAWTKLLFNLVASENEQPKEP